MNVNLMHGDCLELMKTIPDKSVDLILCDMPYGTTKCKWDTILDLNIMWNEYNRIIKTKSAIILFAQTPFDKVLGCSNLSKLKYELIWEKSHATGYLNANKIPMKSHENILIFYDKLPTYNPQKTDGHVRKISTKRRDNTEIYGTQNFDEITYDSTQRFPRSVLKFSSDKQTSTLHPTQKPIALLEWLIKSYTNECDIVLDNCMGSGSTGVACLNTNRNFIGIELDDNYFKIASDRIDIRKQEIESKLIF